MCLITLGPSFPDINLVLSCASTVPVYFGCLKGRALSTLRIKLSLYLCPVDGVATDDAIYASTEVQPPSNLKAQSIAAWRVSLRARPSLSNHCLHNVG